MMSMGKFPGYQQLLDGFRQLQGRVIPAPPRHLGLQGREQNRVVPGSAIVRIDPGKP